jgi:hypothetical protein
MRTGLSAHRPTERCFCQYLELLQERKVGLLLTYADFSAIGFFRKQAFEKTVDTAEKEWSGYIKAYEGGALMECRVEG